MSFLDENGLSLVWEKIKAKFVDQSTTINGKPLSSNVVLEYTDLSGIPVVCFLFRQKAGTTQGVEIDLTYDEMEEIIEAKKDSSIVIAKVTGTIGRNVITSSILRLVSFCSIGPRVIMFEGDMCKEYAHYFGMTLTPETEGNWQYYYESDDISNRAVALYNALNTTPVSKGSSTNPVYFTDGVPKECSQSFDDYLPKTGGQVDGHLSFGGTDNGIDFINAYGEINGHQGSGGSYFHNMHNPTQSKDGANKEYVDNGDEWQSTKGEIGYDNVCTAYAAITYRKHGNNKIDISCRYTVNDVANASGFNVFDISKVASLIGVNNIVTSVGITRISAFSSADGHALGTGNYSGYAGLSLTRVASTNSWQIYRWNNTTLDGGGGWAISSLISSPYKFYGTFDIYGATYT